MKKLIFAQQLRGIASLVVVISHLLGIYWGMREAIAGAIHAPVNEVTTPAIAAISMQSYYELGPLGVALFFFISGFVIPFSFSSLSGGTSLNGGAFLVARAFRIYPTYIACTLISIAAVYASAAYWGGNYVLNIDNVIANSLLVHNYLGIASIDLVNWTLAVEIKFYILAALIAPLIRRYNVYPLFAIAVMGCLLNVYSAPLAAQLSDAASIRVLQQFTIELMYIGFMCVGILFYYHYQGRLTTRQLCIYAAVLLGVFIVTWKHGLMAAQFDKVIKNYFYAFFFFTLAYCYRHRFRPVGLLDFLADISYPLYVLHCLVGWSLLSMLMTIGLGYELALVFVLLIVIGLAYLVHRLVELPSNRLGKSLAATRLPVAAIN